MSQEPDGRILAIRACRFQIRDTLDRIENMRVNNGGGSRETSLAVTKLQEASMWLVQELYRLDDRVSCHPNRHDPIDPPEPTAAIRNA